MSTNARPTHKIIARAFDELKCTDHDFHLASLITSVDLELTVPDLLHDSWHRGKVSITIRDAVFNSTNAWKHCSQLALRLIRQSAKKLNILEPTSLKTFFLLTREEKQKIMLFIPSVLLISTDGGGDHKNTFVRNKAAYASLFKFLDLDELVIFRNAPNGSWINPVETSMGSLNLGLMHLALERDKCRSDMVEKIVTNCNSMSDLRSKAKTNPNVEEEFKRCLKDVITTLESRFRMIESGGEGFVNVEHPACNIDDVAFLQHHLCETTDYRLDVTTTKEANKLPVFSHIFENHNSQSCNYILQLSKPPTRTPSEVHEYLNYKLPLPWKNDPNDENFCSYDDTVAILKDGKKLDERYFPSESTSRHFGPSTKGQEEDRIINRKLPTSLFTQKNLIGEVYCQLCSKPRLVYRNRLVTFVNHVSDKLLMKSLQRYTETVMSYQCGFDVVVDGDEKPLKEAVYVKKENRCGTLLERNYFSATYQRKNKNWIERCIYCGTIDDLEEPNGAKDLVRRARKVCPKCNANQNLPIQLYGKRDFLLLKKNESTLNSKAKKEIDT